MTIRQLKEWVATQVNLKAKLIVSLTYNSDLADMKYGGIALLSSFY